MAESNNRFNKPISDEALYAAGMPRDIPDKEPVPPPPPVLPPDRRFAGGIAGRAVPSAGSAAHLVGAIAGDLWSDLDAAPWGCRLRP